ncbi:MAG: Ig-like domain-containing protein [Gammaproteobacteria bacterium]|nr:Ig-like domain-containing protein [Gammaproteobacteria bacterium]
MRLNRFTLVAAVLALGAAACGDDVQVVEPTPPVPPPPPPVTATMAPASASVAVGNSVVFAVNASGGVAGEAASWTCSSSNTGIATATSTSAGCSATGVAAGDVTITASVSKSGETVNVGAQLTVTSDEPVVGGDPAFIVISSIGTGAEAGIQPERGFGGSLAVGVNVERGDQTLERVSLLVDGEVVDYQSFGGSMGMMPSDDAAAEQAIHTFTLTVNTAEYDEATGAPKYMNGDHMISAELQIAGAMMADGMMGHETISSNVQTVQFHNGDGLHVTADFPGNSAMNPETGDLWYGGPGSGDFTIGAVPVRYSDGGAVESVTLLSVCGGDAITDDAAPFEFTLDCDESGSVTPVFSASAGGEALLNLSPVNETIFPLNLDFVGPDAPHFSVNPYGREDGWVNPTVDFLGEQKSSNKNGWLVYNDDEEGVGGYQPVLRFSTTTPSIVDGALAAVPNALPTAPTKKDAACVIATAVDLLGNESKLPKASTACVTAANYAADEDGDYPAGLRAGLDVAAPTIEFTTASPKADASSLKEFQLQVADVGASSTGKSGLHSVPVLAKIELRDADNDIICGDDDDAGGAAGEEKINGECVLAGGLDFNDPLATTDGLDPADVEDGYYTFTARAVDKAGNMSETVVRTAVDDDEDPELGLIVGGYSKGNWSVTATLTDNLSLKSYWLEAFDNLDIDGTGAADILILPREGDVAVDEYNSPDLTQSLLTTPPVTMQTYRAMQAAGPDAAPNVIDSVRVVATDHGGENGSASNMSLGTATTLDRFGHKDAATGLAAGDGAGQFEDDDLTYARNEVFQTFTVVDDEDDEDTLELRATIEGTANYTVAVAAVEDDPATTDVDETAAAIGGVEGLVDNPVSRVDFYAAVELKDTAGANRVPPAPGGVGNEALLFLGSASAAGAEDFVDDQDNTDPADDVDMRKYVWGIDISAADFLEAVDGEGSNTASYRIFAIAVNSDGVAISALSEAIAVND